MTITETNSTVSPLQRTIAMYQAHLDIALTAAEIAENTVFAGKIDQPTFLTWHYAEPYELCLASDDERREAALEWLRTHTRFLTMVLRKATQRSGPHLPVLVKYADNYSYGVRAQLGEEYGYVTISASVPAATACTIEETGEIELIERPVTRRVCPPSIFAGVENEVRGVGDND